MTYFLASQMVVQRMKGVFRYFFLCLLLGFSNELAAQAPQGVHFQAVARNASGLPLSSTGITVAFAVKDGGGTTVYNETHATTTDVFGLFKLVLGSGTPTLGSFAAINWGGSQHQVQVSVNGVSLGTTPFQSVPYALYAENAGGVWSLNGTNAHYDGGRVGIGTNAPKATLHMPDTANLLIGNDLTGTGFKMIYYAAKGAMRVGFLTNPFGGYNYDKFWDYDSVGYYSFAAGQNSRAKGFGSFAFGSFGWADGSGSVAFFGNAKGNGSFSFGGSSIGRGSITFEGTAEDEGGIAMYGYTGGRYGVSIGGGTTGLGASSSREDYAVAIGWNSDARGQASVALGPNDAYGYNSFSTGWVTEARGNYSSTFGYRTNSFPYASMALGRYNVITGDSAAWVGSDPIFMIGDGTSNTARSNSFMIQKNGQTAIGYNSPVGMLNISTALGSLSNGGLDPTNASLLLGTVTNGLAFDANQIEVIGGGLYLNINSPEDVYLVNGGGQVGIGTAAPSDRLQVDALAGEDALRVRVGGVTRLRVHDNGGASIGANFTPPAAGLYVSGATALNGQTYPNVDNAYSLGTTTRRWTAVYAVNGAIQTSDARLKTKTQPIPYGLATLSQLRPVSYFWKDPSVYDGRKIGLIAQEVRKVVPEVVYGEESETLGVNYAELVPVLIQAIQEQQVQIEALQAEKGQLEAEQSRALQSLLSRVQRLETSLSTPQSNTE